MGPEPHALGSRSHVLVLGAVPADHVVQAAGLLRLRRHRGRLVLALGMSLATQLGPEDSGGRGTSDGRGDRLTGAALMVLLAWISACAGVLNEWLIKRSPDVLQANVWLYTFGSLTALLQLALTAGGVMRLATLHGFSLTSWLVVVCNAVLGQSIAFLLKYADSIIKLYGVCASMLLTTLVSVMAFALPPHFNMVLGTVLCAISVCMYYLPAELLIATDSEAAKRCLQRAVKGENKHDG